jgi:CPA1 family monovalent cation:H+ antiporter
MDVFEVVIALLVGGVALAGFARRFNIPYPALVALAGAAAALIPGAPKIALDPELALALFVAPVLVDSAFDSSPRDMRANWRPIASLALGAVALTIIVVATVAHLLVPAMPWAAAIALGAIVAPPDAAAATTVLKQLRPPHRLLVILEGESLFNDASALLVYRIAVGAVATGFVSGWSVVPTLLLVTIGSVILGVVLSRITIAVNARIHDLASVIIVQFCGTFLVWILAERLHLSGIITIVVFGISASRRASEVVPARLRIPSWAIWEVAVFVLNLLAFILVGFQLEPIVSRVSAGTGLQSAGFAAAVLIAAMAARIGWVSLAAAFGRRTVGLSGRAAAVVGWCGMRGTVTLAAALALPIDFPYRDLILATAFGVTLGTLVIQGMTVRPLLLRLGLEDDGSVEREIRLARVETLRAAVAAADACPGAESAQLVVRRYELQLERAEAGVDDDGTGAGLPERDGEDNDVEVIRTAMEAQRRRLLELRGNGTIGDAAFQRIEEELDYTELGWAQVVGVE